MPGLLFLHPDVLPHVAVSRHRQVTLRGYSLARTYRTAERTSSAPDAPITVKLEVIYSDPRYSAYLAELDALRRRYGIPGDPPPPLPRLTRRPTLDDDFSVSDGVAYLNDIPWFTLSSVTLVRKESEAELGEIIFSGHPISATKPIIDLYKNTGFVYK